MSTLSEKMLRAVEAEYDSRCSAAVIELSVIIVSYNNYGVLRDCLESIERFNDIGPALEVIVVEQSPKDDIFNCLRSDFGWVRSIRNENKGFGAGNNVGARVALGRFLLFLNPDTVFVEPVFGFTIERFEANPKLGLFGVRLVDREGNRNQSFYFRKPYGLFRGSVLYRICDRFDIFMPKSMYITGADMFVRADAFAKVGGFDERMFMYFEETYLCKKMIDNGYNITYYHQHTIVHLEGQSTPKLEVFKVRLDSLRVLCDDFGFHYLAILKKMKCDRKIKAALDSQKNERLSEIAEIDIRIGLEGSQPFNLGRRKSE